MTKVSYHRHHHHHHHFSSTPSVVKINLSNGDYFLDGPIFVKSGVIINGGYSDDAPNYPFFQFYNGPNSESTGEDAMIVIDGVTGAEVSTLLVQ